MKALRTTWTVVTILGLATLPALGVPGGFTIEQAISDEAQRTTIAFDGLAFLSGSIEADSFFPPGKVADFWGFQYLRDNDLTEMGHNTDFLTRASFNTLNALTAAQRAELVALAGRQVSSIRQYAYDRFVLMKAFRRLLEGDLPSGSAGLNAEAVKAYSIRLYHLDGQISFERAQVMGGILRNLSASQRASLDAMVGRGMLDWPVTKEPEDLRGLAREVKEAVMTYAGDMFSWYAGSPEADEYFCPERHGTYFGSFYMKDAPAVGNPGYSIDTRITAESGRAFLAALTPAQAALVSNLVNSQKPALLDIVSTRRAISVQLRRFIAGDSPSSEAVLGLADRYGALDGEIVASYAVAFASVGRSLTAAQKTQLAALRKQVLGDFSPTSAYLYAEPIPMPTIPSTDFLF